MSLIAPSEEEKFITDLEGRISRRKKEITSLNLGIAEVGDLQTKFAFIRASVALLYAHWEGSIKESTLMFLKFLDHRELDLSALRGNYVILLNPDGIEMTVSEAIRKVRNTGNILEGSVNSAFVRRMCWRLCLDYQAFMPMEEFIDRILRLRNGIVHGEGGSVGYDDFVDIAAQVQKLIDCVQDQFASSVNAKSYMRSMIANV